MPPDTPGSLACVYLPSTSLLPVSVLPLFSLSVPTYVFLAP